MDNFLSVEDRRKISEKFTDLRERSKEYTNNVSFLSWLEGKGALNIDKMKELANEPDEKITDPETLRGVRQIMAENKKGREKLESLLQALKELPEYINGHIYVWGASGRLIDRDTVIKALEAIKEKINDISKEAGK